MNWQNILKTAQQVFDQLYAQPARAVGNAVGKGANVAGGAIRGAVKGVNFNPPTNQQNRNVAPQNAQQLPGIGQILDAIKFGQYQAPSLAQFYQMSKPGGGLGQLQVPGAPIQYNPNQPDPGEFNYYGADQNPNSEGPYAKADTTFLDLFNNMAPGGGLGNVQNPYQLNRDNTPTRGIPDWAAFRVDQAGTGFDGTGYSGPNMGINFNPYQGGVNLNRLRKSGGVRY